MKKSILFVLSFILFSTSLAQSPVSKGVYSVSGSIAYSSSDEEKGNESSLFLFSPSAGYFFFDNIYTGLSLDYVNYTHNKNSTARFGIGPSIRYYFDANETLKPFIGLSYSYLKQDSYLIFNEYALNVGANLFMTNYFAVEGRIDYKLTSYNPSTVYSIGDSVTKTLRILLGVNYFIH
ncbi:MAG: porin family protein [Bacteroidetes bacterium]|nr:porin family protein [Bacteroidota bacterium]MBU1679955.1 porin family protein [Bacteroidota bacterium]